MAKYMTINQIVLEEYLESFLLIFTLLICFSYDSYQTFGPRGKIKSRLLIELNTNYHFEYDYSYNRHIIVSYFYPVTQGNLRHPLSDYKARFDRFLKLIKVPTIIYTKRKHLRMMNITSVPSNMIINEKYESPYDICNLQKYRDKYKEVAKLMNKTEKYIVTDVFGAIWNAKVCLIKDALDNSNYMFGHWLDIGMFKNDEYDGHELNSTRRMDSIFNNIPNKVLFGAISSPDYFKMVPIERYNIRKNDFLTGGYIGGSRSAINSFYNEFFRLHDYFIGKLQYVCRDEFLYSTYCLYNPQNCSYVFMGGNKCYTWHSSIGFLFPSNPCEFPTNIYHIYHKITKFSIIIREFSSPF